MCEICTSRLCPPPCPNYAARVVGVCAYCEEVIYDYEPHLTEEERGRRFHTECLESIALPELLELFDIDVEVEE